MSLWHSPQASESMKKLEGMILPVLVWAEEGANGECAPAPSWSIESGGLVGFTMKLSGSGCTVRQSAAEAGNSRRIDTHAAKAAR